jgi:serine/threonine protein kinase
VRPPASHVSGKIPETGIGKVDDRTIAHETREDTVPPTRTRLQPLGARDPLLGRVVAGKYRVLGLVARGGMSRVYRAVQAPLGRICALKILDVGDPPDAGETCARDHVFRKRLLREASTMAKLRHPNTVTVFDFGEVDDTVSYIAMEYLHGQTLASAIRQAGHFPEHRRLPARCARHTPRASSTAISSRRTSTSSTTWTSRTSSRCSTSGS